MTALLAFALAACSPGQGESQEAAKPHTGLFSTLPIYWGEGGMSAIFDGGAERDWARTLIEKRFAIDPLDTLEADALEGASRVIMAQPRPLAPSENVALDTWLRAGGRLLIFADPMLTRHSDYALGDKRRPQDVVLISPILKRWGLELRFDENQPAGERWVDAYDGAFPVNLAGEFALLPASGCIVSETGLLAQCKIGEGRVTLLADAAILDGEAAQDGAPRRAAALDSLIAAALDF